MNRQLNSEEGSCMFKQGNHKRSIDQQEGIGTSRIEAFSDGVFAIALTLLVLSIHIPLPSDLQRLPKDHQDLWYALNLQWPTYLSFLLSFIIVGVVWSNHHTMFSYIKRSNHLLVVFNLLLMLIVVILPFSASLLALYLGKPEQQTAVAIYCGVLVIGGIVYNLPWLYASSGSRLIDRGLDKQVIKQVTRRYAAGPCLYAVAFGLSFLWNGVPGLIACALLALGYLLPTVADRVRPTQPTQQSSASPQTLSPHREEISLPDALPALQEGRASQRKILLTGAAGGIGAAFFQHAAETYTFCLADRICINFVNGTEQDHEVIQLDIADLDACQQACKGIDTVIHLAADANPDADFSNSLLSNNIQGTYNILRAAKDQGCRRVILASSLQVLIGYAPDVQMSLASPLRPMNMYGVSKCFGEAVASYFAHAEGLSCIVVRIGSYDVQNDPSNWLRQDPNRLSLAGYVSPRDLNQLLIRCIEVPEIPFALVNGISNNRFKRVDLTPTRDLLKYQPEDDAFEIFKDDLQVWLGQ